jgi:hypothetical protein
MKFAVKAGKLIFRMRKCPKEVAKVEKRKRSNLWEACLKCKRNKGKSAYGQSKAGCTLLPYTLPIKNIRKPVHDCFKRSTVNLKDFKPMQGCEGLLRFDDAPNSFRT